MSRWPSRPGLSMRFYKAHGLGNDYLVFEEGGEWVATVENIRRVCERHRGVGGDGIVVLSPGDAPFRLRMFNPDGSEFERSGNGLRVLASHLAAQDRVGPEPFDVVVGGDTVRMRVHGREGGTFDVSCEMGRAQTGPAAVGLDPGLLSTEGTLAGPHGGDLRVVPVSVGNPHLVVLGQELSEARLAEVGPHLTAHPGLAHGANVQLAEVISPGRMRALIWERGVGRTSASGTSSCAVAVAGVSAGLIEPGTIVVEMPGGELRVEVSNGLDVVLRGPVAAVMTGEVDLDLVTADGEES